MNTDFLNQSIEFVKGVGPARSKLLGEELNLKTIKDLIDFYPFRYIDRSRFYKIDEIPKNQSEVQIIGKIKIPISTNRPGNRKKYLCLKFICKIGLYYVFYMWPF